MKNFTSIDRLINKFRKKGIYLYTTIVIFSTIYAFYSLNSIKPKNNNDKSIKNIKDIKKKINELKKDEEKKGLLEENKDYLESNDSNIHPVDSWTKSQLYTYLLDFRVFPDIDDDLESVRLKVKHIYDKKMGN